MAGKQKKTVHNRKRTEKNRKKQSFITVYKWSVPLLIAIVVLILVMVLVNVFSPKEKEPLVTLKYMTESEIEKVVEIEELATYRTKYEGVVTVYKEGKEETEDNIFYHVAYDSTVTFGIDTAKNPIRFEIENPKDSVEGEQPIVEDLVKKGSLKVILPKIKMVDTTVDIGSLDFIFKDWKAKKDDKLVADAYQRCTQDVSAAMEKKPEMYGFAKDSCENTIKALMKPFLEQYKKKYFVDYELIIEWEE